MHWLSSKPSIYSRCLWTACVWMPPFYSTRTQCWKRSSSVTKTLSLLARVNSALNTLMASSHPLYGRRTAYIHRIRYVDEVNLWHHLIYIWCHNISYTMGTMEGGWTTCPRKSRFHLALLKKKYLRSIIYARQFIPSPLILLRNDFIPLWTIFGCSNRNHHP